MAQTTEVAPAEAETRLRMTYEEWLAWPGSESKQTEWVDGEVIVFVPPTGLHQDAIGFLFILLHQFADLTGAGVVRQAPFEVRLSPTRSREPDILFVANRHLDRLSDKRLDGPPDLAVEVVSPSSVQRDHRDRLGDYALAGVPEYWLFESRPGRRRHDFYRLQEDGTYDPAPLDTEGRYHSTVLPGFWFKPDWLWENPRPATLVCLSEIAPDLMLGALGDALDRFRRHR